MVLSFAVENVKKYLLSIDYDKETIFDDIKETASLFKEGKVDFFFQGLLRDLLEKRRQEALDFFNAYYNFYHMDNEIHLLYVYMKVPFKNAIDPKVERDLLCKIFDIDDTKNDVVTFFHVLCFLLKTQNVVLPDSFDNDIMCFLHDYGSHYENISFDNLKKARYAGHVDPTPYPRNVEEGVKMFLESQNDIEYGKDIVLHFNEPEVNDSSKTPQGRLAEAYAYNYLVELYGFDSNVIWVARDAGDNFGYDIMVWNGKDKIYYEIKSFYDYKDRKFDFESEDKEKILSEYGERPKMREVVAAGGDYRLLWIGIDASGNATSAYEHKYGKVKVQ